MLLWLILVGVKIIQNWLGSFFVLSKRKISGSNLVIRKMVISILSLNITPPKTLDLSFAGFFNLLIESKFGVTQLHPKKRNCHWIWAASPGPVWVNFFRNECTWPKLKPFLMDPLELFQIWICLTNSHYCWD